nr:thiol-activated cytolysin C-terminal domain-containing protein [Bacillus mycoides]
MDKSVRGHYNEGIKIHHIFVAIKNEQNVPLTNEIKVSIGGTTLYPTASISH